MPYIEIYADVDLDQFSVWDLFDALETKLAKIKTKKELEEHCDSMEYLLDIFESNGIKFDDDQTSLADVMKQEYLDSVFDKLSEVQFREAIEGYIWDKNL